MTLAITAGVLTADLILAPAPNGLTVTASGAKAPTNTTASVTTASVSGTAASFASGASGPVGPVLLVPPIVNPSADRTMIGLFIARAVGEQINWTAGSTGIVSFQSSDDGGTTWQTQTQNYYAGVSGVQGYGGHSSAGLFGPIAAGATLTGATLQFRMYVSCSAGAGAILNTGDMDCRVFMVNQ